MQTYVSGGKKHAKYPVWLNESGYKQAYKLAAAGYTYKDIAAAFSVSRRTLLYWRKRSPELQAALDAGFNAMLLDVDALRTYITSESWSRKRNSRQQRAQAVINYLTDTLRGIR
jgi:transposase-like protein